MSAANLQDAGYRFVLRGMQWSWVHPLEVQPGDIDHTDLDDVQFEAEVRRVHGVFFAPLAVVDAFATKATGAAS